MAFCKSCGTQLDEGAKFCRNCGTPVDQVAPQATLDATAVIPPVAPPAAAGAGFAPPVAPAPGGPKKSMSGLIIGLVIAAVVILGVLGGGLAFAMSKGYGWLPENLTRKARAEAALDVLKAFGAQDFGELQDLSTGELKDLLKKYADELDSDDTPNVKISDKEWDGKELTFEIAVEDESDDVTIEPDDSSTDVKVVIKDEDGKLEIEMEYDDGWKATDVLIDGESFVDELSNAYDSSSDEDSSEDSSEDDEAYSDDSPAESEYSDDSLDDLDAEQTECFDNQVEVESGASESSWDYDDLAGTVDDEHLLVTDDGWFDEAPTCPTTGDYYELDSDGAVYGCPEHGYYGDYDY